MVFSIIEYVAQLSPTGDAQLASNDTWQFWVVSVVALLAGLWIIWRMVPKKWLSNNKRGTSTRATLTVSGKTISRAKKHPPKCNCH